MGNWTRGKGQIGYILLISTLMTIFLARFYYQSSFVSSWDSVDFVLGVEQFDLLLMQPHFPGYPYFILGGMFFNYFLKDPVASLITFNQTIMMTATIPIYLLARHYAKGWQVLLVVVSVQSLSYLSLLSTQAMSEAAAIGVLWWFIWSIFYSINNKSFLVRLLPALLFSILLGIRLSYLPFGIALLFLWWDEWKNGKQALRLLLLMVFAILFQFVWVLALAYSEGGIGPFIELALAFTQGHFQEWGGTAVASDSGIIARLSQLLFINFFWNGLASRSIVMIGLLIAMLLLLFYFITKRREKPVLFINKLLLTVFISYFIWALFAQNIEKPRHIAPLLGIFTLYTSSSLLRFAKRRTLNTVTVVLLLLFISGQLFTSFQVMKQQKYDMPAEYQLAHSNLFQKGDILFTWEETRVLHYLDVPFAHTRVFTYDYFLQKIYEHDEGKIYVTNKVVEGFASQGVAVDNYISKVEVYKYSSFIDPIYHTIVIYEWHEGR